MLSRQEVNTMRHLANAQYWDRPAGGNTGRLFLAFGGPVCADRFSNCPLDRVLTYKNLIYLLNLQFSPLLAAILDFSGKWWSVNILKTVRDRAISSKFLIRRVVEDYPMQRGKISIFATFGGHLGFLRKMMKCEYLKNCMRQWFRANFWSAG